MVGLSSRSSSGRGPADQGSDNLDSTRGALAEIVARSFRKRKASVCFRARRATVSIAGLKAYRRSSPTRRLDSRWIVKSDLRDPSGDWQIAYEFEPWVVGLNPDGYLNDGKAARTITDFAKGDEVSLDIENQDNSIRACVRVMHPNGLIGHVETSFGWLMRELLTYKRDKWLIKLRMEQPFGTGLFEQTLPGTRIPARKMHCTVQLKTEHNAEGNGFFKFHAAHKIKDGLRILRTGGVLAEPIEVENVE